MTDNYWGQNLWMIEIFSAWGWARERCAGTKKSRNCRSVARGGRRWWRQEAGLHTLWKKVRESLSRLSINEFKLTTNNMLGYDIPVWYHGWNWRWYVQPVFGWIQGGFKIREQSLTRILQTWDGRVCRTSKLVWVSSRCTAMCVGWTPQTGSIALVASLN